MKRTPPSAKTPKSTSPAKPVAKSAVKPAAVAKKAPAKKPTSSKSPPRLQLAPPAPATPPASKQSQLISLLESSTGATLAQMMTLTGWQSHIVRGMLSGSLRKRLGLDVQSRMEEGVRVYRILEGSAK
jgi:hypothetical protein